MYQAGLLFSASSLATVPVQQVGAGPGQAVLCRLSGDSEQKAQKCTPLGRPLPAEGGLAQLRRVSSRVGGLPAGPGAARAAVFPTSVWPAGRVPGLSACIHPEALACVLPPAEVPPA